MKPVGYKIKMIVEKKSDNIKDFIHIAIVQNGSIVGVVTDAVEVENGIELTIGIWGKAEVMYAMKMDDQAFLPLSIYIENIGDTVENKNIEWKFPN